MNETALAERPVDAAIVVPPASENAITEVDDFKGYMGVATMQIPQDKIAVLMEVLPDESHDILPTGEVYVSQVHYRRKLNTVFGPGMWALVPRGSFLAIGTNLCREYALVVGGRFISEAVGEQEYHPNNPRDSYATATEGCKSNALVRCCKDLGMAAECWDRQWTEAWKTRFAVQVWRKEGGKPQWRRRDAKPFFDETGPVAGQNAPSASPAASRAVDAPSNGAPQQPPMESRSESRQTRQTSAPPPVRSTESGGSSLEDDIRAVAGQVATIAGMTPSEAISRASAFFSRDHQRTGDDMSDDERWNTKVPMENGVVSFSDPGGKSVKWAKGTIARLRAYLEASAPNMAEGVSEDDVPF